MIVNRFLNETFNLTRQINPYALASLIDAFDNDPVVLNR
jgi:hypothetical protein